MGSSLLMLFSMTPNSPFSVPSYSCLLYTSNYGQGKEGYGEGEHYGKGEKHAEGKGEGYGQGEKYGSGEKYGQGEAGSRQ